MLNPNLTDQEKDALGTHLFWLFEQSRDWHRQRYLVMITIQRKNRDLETKRDNLNRPTFNWEWKDPTPPEIPDPFIIEAQAVMDFLTRNSSALDENHWELIKPSVNMKHIITLK